MDIGLSNLSLAYITMSFYTMCKSTVPVFLLFFAFIWRIERWDARGMCEKQLRPLSPLSFTRMLSTLSFY